MSVFNKDDANDHSIDTSDITLDALVGDTQKYKTADDLAKAYANADAYISTMKQKEVEREAELKVLRDLLESNKKNSDDGDNTPPGDQRQNDPPAGNQPNGEDDKDLSKLIAEELERQNTQKSFADNVNTVSEKLSNHYGGERQAKEAIQRKAKELNVGVDWLMDVAGRSPAAFYSTIGLDQRSFATPGVQGDVNTGAFNKDTNRKNFKYYEELRKTSPKAYYSAQVQKEMFASAREQGEKFYT